MDKDGCGSCGVWNTFSYISLDDMFLSVYYWDYLQVGLCAVVYYCSAGLGWSLEKIDNL